MFVLFIIVAVIVLVYLHEKQRDSLVKVYRLFADAIVQAVDTIKDGLKKEDSNEDK